MGLIVLALVVGAALGYELCRIGALNILKYIIATEWRDISGRVESYDLISSLGLKGGPNRSFLGLPISAFLIRVQYQVEGRTYETCKVSPWDFISVNNYSKDIHHLIEEQIRKNGRVSVNYDPQNPARAVITPKIGGRVWYEIVTALLLVAAVIPVQMWYATAGEYIAPLDLVRYVLYGSALGVGAGAILFIRVHGRLKEG